MSRRKQSNPVKSVTDDSDDEADRPLHPDIGLPSHILHLDTTLTPPVISSISTILEGSQFGPFPCSLSDISEAPGNNLRLQLNRKEFNVHITTPSGLWLHLVKTSHDSEETNFRLIWSGEKILCLVTKNILPDVEIVAYSRVKLAEGAEDHMEKNSVEVKTEVPDVEMEARRSVKLSPPVVIKNEPQPDESTLNSRTASNSHHGKNIMIQNLLNRTKPSYELVHDCIFCGVKFSNPRTLQAHLTNYCSKKPQFDLCSSPTNFIFYSILPNHLRYNLANNQTSPDLGAKGTGSRKNNKTPWNVENIQDKIKSEDETAVVKEHRSDMKSEQTDLKINSPIDEISQTSRNKNNHSNADKQVIGDVFKYSNETNETSDIFQPFSNFQSSSVNSRFPLLNCFPNFPLDILNKKYFENHSLPPFLNPFLLFPSYFMNSSGTLKTNSELIETVDDSKQNPPTSVFSISPSSSTKKRSSTEEKSSTGRNSFPSKVENPLDLSSKKENTTTSSSEIRESTTKSFPVDAAFSGKFRTSSSSEPKHSEPAFPFRLNPPSTNRCIECNIVFFKTENYLAHKQHYCASRNNRLRDISQQSSTKTSSKNDKSKNAKSVENSKISSDDQTSSDLNNNNNTNSDMELVATLSKGILQYYCIPCKIKFSNLETLKAHKKFYCSARFSRNGKSPERFDEESADVCSEEAKEGEKKVFTCSACRMFFPSEQLLMLHFCTGVAANYQLYQCPHCDHIAQSDNRLMEHIRGHAPSKVYKCIICGYRGNTVRGMRMHGKMHNDAGETFTDDSMLEIEEPPIIPKKTKLSIGDPALFGSVLDMPDLELIRLKNEPYKRRRSRKAYEKSEYMTRENEQNPCIKCEMSFPIGVQSEMHNLEIKSNTIMPNKSESSSNHLEINKNSPSPLAPKRSNTSSNLHEGPSAAKVLKLSPKFQENEESNLNLYPKFEIKELSKQNEDEKRSSGRSNSPFSSEKSKPSSRNESTSKYCKQCNINFMYASTYLAHKKYYCANQIEEDADISVC